MLGFDKEFLEYFDKIRGLDWTGLDLWVFGGIVSHWNTKDIDSIIIGDKMPEGFLKSIINLGPWDISYTKDTSILWKPGDQPVKVKVLTPQDKWIYYKIPTRKHRMRLKYGVQYGKPIQLINNGVIQQLK